MQSENLDSFIEYLYTVEESVTTLTADQVQKLSLIHTKVSEIVSKLQRPVQVQEVTKPHISLKESSNEVYRFEEFVYEKLVKQGKSLLVKDSKGKKILGTHPSKKNAIKQIQPIEISKKESR